jgi:hypothetical protein
VSNPVTAGLSETKLMIDATALWLDLIPLALSPLSQIVGAARTTGQTLDIR